MMVLVWFGLVWLRALKFLKFPKRPKLSNFPKLPKLLNSLMPLTSRNLLKFSPNPQSRAT